MGLFDKLKGLVLGIQEAQRQKAATTPPAKPEPTRDEPKPAPRGDRPGD